MRPISSSSSWTPGAAEGQGAPLTGDHRARRLHRRLAVPHRRGVCRLGNPPRPLGGTDAGEANRRFEEEAHLRQPRLPSVHRSEGACRRSAASQGGGRSPVWGLRCGNGSVPGCGAQHTRPKRPHEIGRTVSRSSGPERVTIRSGGRRGQGGGIVGVRQVRLTGIRSSTYRFCARSPPPPVGLSHPPQGRRRRLARPAKDHGLARDDIECRS